MDNYLIFHNAADDSYMNTAANFRGAFASTQTVDIYFKSAKVGGDSGAGYDKIIVACTNGEEDRAVEELASAIGGGKSGGYTVIADDVNSVYACQNITSVTSITMAATGNIKDVTTINADTTLYTYDSGKTYMISATGGTVAITLPTAAGSGTSGLMSGVNYKFVVKEETPANAITIAAGSAIIDMVQKDAGGDASNSTAGTAVSNLVVGTSAQQGDVINIFTDGTTYYAECFSGINNAVTTS